MDDSAAGRDNRAHPRTTVMRRGVVVDSDTGQTYRCIIIDVSAGGAKLQLLVPGLPSGALSLIDLEPGSNHDLRVVWRNPPLVGVAFLSTSALP